MPDDTLRDPSLLSADELRLMLRLIRGVEGPGYSDDMQISALQTKLSIMLAMKARHETINQVKESKP